jgi:hypothetical protein
MQTIEPHALYAGAPKFGIAGNMAGHLEQAGEAGDFTQVTAAPGQPKGMFPYHVPGHDSFLGVDPVSSDRLVLPGGEDAGRVQAEPEVGLVVALDWAGDRVAAVRPLGFTAYNDASVRRPAPKISRKKNWGPHTKGLAAEVVPLDGLAPGGPLDRYHLMSFLLRDGVLHDYGEDCAVRTYACFHEALLTWIAGRLNEQVDQGPLEHLAPLLGDQPARAVIGIGATRYVDLPVSDRLQPGDEIIIVVYDRSVLDGAGLRRAIERREPLPPGNPVLRQRVESAPN